MKLFKKSLLSAMISIAVMVSVSSVPAEAADASGSLAVKSAVMNAQNKSILMTFAISLQDNDGISSSTVTCTNLAGKEIFSLSFK